MAKTKYLPGKNHTLIVHGIRRVFVLPGGEVVGDDRPMVQDAIAQGYYPGSEIRTEEDQVFCFGQTTQSLCFKAWGSSAFYRDFNRRRSYSDFRLEWR